MMRALLKVCLFVLVSIYSANCQGNSDSSCDTLTVSGVGDGVFDGTYRPTNYSVSWMADEDVYQKVNGTKYLFPLNSTSSGLWGIGSIASLITGQYDFQGIMEDNSTWSGTGNLSGRTLLITDTSTGCSNGYEEFPPPSMNVVVNGSTVRYTADPDDEDYFDDITGTRTSGINRCNGKMAIYYGPVGNPLSNFKVAMLPPKMYRRTSRMFRRKQIVKVEIWGHCNWMVFARTQFRGRNMTLTGGYNSRLNFQPKSIKNVF